MSIAVNIKKNLGSFRLDVAFSQESGVLALLDHSDRAGRRDRRL